MQGVISWSDINSNEYTIKILLEKECLTSWFGACLTSGLTDQLGEWEMSRA
jgi:hypothetical protein